MVHQVCYIKGFIGFGNTAFTLNYSTDISLRCCKVSRALQLCSTAFLIIEKFLYDEKKRKILIIEFNRLIIWFSAKLSLLGHSSVQFSSVAQSCPTLCDPMNRSTPGLPVHHHLPEFTQTHVHRVSDAIQPSHPLLSPSPPAPNPSQHQSLFQ